MDLPQWTYRSKQRTSIEDFPKYTKGFIYIITFSDGCKYIGSKVLQHKKKLKPLKGKKKARYKFKESDWLTYCGSSDIVKEKLKSKKIYVTSRKILKLCKSDWELTYYETKYLFSYDALLRDDFYNGNILGKFYKPRT